MKILKRIARAAALFSACALWSAEAGAAVPERISYQGTLRKDGILYSGAVPMEFRITNANGGTLYWTSGSTDVVVTGGLFRYTLGVPNEAAFAAVQWNAVDAYVQVLLDGGWLPPEPLYSSAYALNARTADGSAGNFTVRDGYIRISTTAGNIGLVFQDGTTQYTSAASVWTVSGADVYISSVSYGNAGVGNSAPQARLDVQSAAGGFPQIWRDSSGAVTASMTAAGFIYADGSQLRNLPPSADNMGSHIATQTVDMGGFQLSNAGAVTASSYTAADARGLGAARVRLNADVELSSAPASQYGGLYVSSNVYITGKYYGDGSVLSNLPIPANIMTLDTGQTVTGVKTYTSSLTVTTGSGVRAPKYLLASNVALSSSTAAEYGGLYVSTHVYLQPGSRYYGDGSALTGVVGLDNLGDHTLTQNLRASIGGTYWYSGDGGNEGVSVDAAGKVSLGGFGSTPAGTVDVRATSGATYVQVWRNIGGTVVSSMAVGGVLYADGSGLRNTLANPAAKDQNMAGYSIVSVSTVSVSSITSSGAGVIFSTNVFLLGRLGIGTASPAEKLDISGGIKIGNTTNTNAGTMRWTGTAFEGYDGSVWLGMNGTFSIDTSSGIWAKGTNSTIYSLSASSNVTIGFNDSGSTNKLRVRGATADSSANALLTEDSGASPLLVVRNDGYVGVGTAGPAYKLNVSGGILATSSITAQAGFYGDGSRLAGIGDSLGTHIATQTLNMGGFQLSNVGAVTASSYTASSALGIGAAQVRLANNVSVSSETQAVLGGGVRISSNVYIVGFSSAAKYYGDGSALTGISGDDLGSHTAGANLNMGVYQITGTGVVTASSYTATGALGVGAPQVRFAPNVFIASGSAADVGGGLQVSSNVYIIGFASATKYYGDGSALTGVVTGSGGGGDSLGAHIATQTVNMAGFNIIGISTVTLSSITASGAQITMSSPLSMAGRNITGVYTLSASSITSPGSEVVLNSDLQVTGALDVRGGGVRIGNTSVPNTGTIRYSGGGFEGYNGTGWIVLNGTYYVDVSTINWGQGINNTIYSQSTSSNVSIGFTDSGGANKLRVRGGTSDATANALLAENSGGAALLAVRNDGNVGIGVASPAVKLDVNGTVNAAAYTGDGSALTGISGDNLGSHTAGANLNMGVYQITGTGVVTASSYTATGGLGVGAPQVRLAPNVFIASGSAAAVGGGLQVSSNVYIIGFASATKYYGDGSGLTGVAASGGGGDSLGAHIATQTLAMGGYDITAVSTITVSSITAYGGGAVTVSADLTVAGTTIRNLGLAGGSNRCVYVDAQGIFRAKSEGSDCGLASPTGDQLGDHILLQNLVVGQFWISRNGASDGLILDGNQNLGVGQPVPGARLDVYGPGGGNTYTQIWRNSGGAVQASMTVAGILYADGSQLRNLPSGDNLGNHTLALNLRLNSNWVSGDGNNEGLAVDGSGNVGVNIAAPEARLDVNGSVAGYTQIWRDGGVVQASMTSAGILYASASGLRNLPALDNLGNHTATQALNLNTNAIVGAGSVTASSYTATNALGIGAAQVRLANNVIVSSMSAAGFGGVRVSSNVYVVGFASATKYYGDGSALTGVVGLDDLGTHIATKNLNMSGFDIVSVSTISVSSITGAGGSVTLSADLLMAGGEINSTKLAGSGTRCLHVNNAGQIGLSTLTGECGTSGATGDNLGDYLMVSNLKTNGYWISYDGSASGISINISSNVGIGVASALTRLDVRPAIGDTYSQIWRNSGGTIVASMTATGRLFADGSALTGVVTSGGSDSLGAHIATQTLDMANFPITNAASVTASSYTATGAAGIGAAQLSLASGISVSSEASAGVGGGVRVSSNIYIVGFSSAAKYYGDGSSLTGFGFPSPVTTNLNMKNFDILNVATMTISTITAPAGNAAVVVATNLDMKNFDILNVSTLTVSSITVASGAGVTVSTNIFVLGNVNATKYYGIGSSLGGIMANPAVADINMNGLYSITNAVNVSMTGSVTASMIILGNALSNTTIQPVQSTLGGILFSTPTYIISYLLVSSHSAIGNTAPAPLADTALLLNETFDEASLTANAINMGLSAIAISSPTSLHPGAMVIGGSFLAGRASGNAYSFESIIGVKTGGWSQASSGGTVTGSYGLYAQNVQSAGDILASYAVFVSTPYKTGGTLANNYGIFIRDQTGYGSTSNYNLFSAGATSRNAFEGMVSIGDTSQSTPAQTAPLQIKANSSSEVMRFDFQSSTTINCKIIFKSAACAGADGSQLGADGGYYLCMRCQ